MAFTGNQQDFSSEWKSYDVWRTKLYNLVQIQHDKGLLGTAVRYDIYMLLGVLTEGIKQYSITPSAGCVAYVKTVCGDSTYDLGTRAPNIVSACTALRQWIFDAFPKAADGSWQIADYAIDGTPNQKTFTTAQLQTIVGGTYSFITACEAFLAAL